MYYFRTINFEKYYAKNKNNNYIVLIANREILQLVPFYLNIGIEIETIPPIKILIFIREKFWET